MKGHQQAKQGGKQRVRAAELAAAAPSSAQIPRMMKNSQKETRLVRKVLCIPGVTASTAGGFIAVQNVVNTSQVSTATAFSALSTLFLEYRVLGMEVEFFPIVDAQTTVATPAPSMLGICKASSGTFPGTFQEIVEGPEGRVVNALRPFKISVSAEGFLDALQWTPIGNTIAVANEFAVAIGDSGLNPASAASTTYLRWVCKFLTEFRSLI